MQSRHLVVVLACAAGLTLAPSAGRAFDESTPPSPYEVDRRAERLAPLRPEAQDRLSRSADWVRYLERHPGWVARWSEAMGIPERAQGPGVAVPGYAVVHRDNLEGAARSFLTQEAGAWLPEIGDLKFVRGVFDGSGYWASFAQEQNGIPVFNARVTLRISADGRVSQLANHSFAVIEAPAEAGIPPAAAVEAARAGLPSGLQPLEAPRLWILPVAHQAEYVHYLTWRVEFRSTDPPGHWICFVDATSASLLWRFNNARDAQIGGFLTGAVEPVTGDNNFVTTPLRYVEMIALSGTDTLGRAVTDSLGRYDMSTVMTPGRAMSCVLAGPYGVIRNANPANPPPFATAGVPAADPAEVTLDFNDSNSLPSQRDAYHSAMLAHDFIKTIEPGFNLLDYPMPIVVDLNQTCNAYWDGYGLNFFAEGGGCVASSRVATIVMHEYAHGISDYMYRPFFPSGAMHEGFSDYYACALTNQPIVGAGFRPNAPQTWIRRLDVPRRFPQDANGQVHNDGLILATALWEVRAALGHTLADRLYHFARYGQSGTFDDYFLDYLSVDDDNGNIYDATPHFTTIANIFRNHGIGDFSIHVSHAGTPDTEDTLKVFPITASFMSLFALQDTTVQIHVTTGWNGSNATTSQVMLPTGGVRQYRLVLGHQPAGTSVSYYFTARDTAGTSVTFPAAGASNPFRFRIGADVNPPAIAHEPLPDQPIDTPSLQILATVTDNLDKGVGPVRLLHRLNGGAETSGLMSLVAGHDYRGFLPTSGVVRGDLYEYRLEAVDSAAVPNTGVDPAGGWHSFRLVRGFNRDFEADAGGLVSDGDWQWGVPSVGPRAYSGTQVWATNLYGAYHDQSTSVLSLPAVDLTQFASAALTFEQIVITEAGYDGGVVEASTNAGAGWQLLVPDGGYNASHVAATGTPGYSGDIEPWTRAEFDLSQFLGQPDVRIRFRFASDPAINGLGWYLDDLQVVERQIKVRPLNLTARSAVDGKVPLAWDPPAGVNEAVHNPVTGYRLYRAATPTATPELVTPVPLTGRSYVDNSVVNGNRYFYYASALFNEGESPLTGPVEGYPFRASFQAGYDSLAAAIDSVGTVDTTLVITNGGTGLLEANVLKGLPSQSIDDLRIRLVTGEPFKPALPATSRPASRRRVSDDLMELLASRTGSPGAKVQTAVLTPPPLATWDTLYVDPVESPPVSPDLATLEVQQTADQLWFRLTAHAPWGDPFQGFNTIILFDADRDQTTGFQGGEYLILAGPICMANFQTLALLLDASLNPIALPDHLVLNANAAAAEFGILKADIGRPVEINLAAQFVSANGRVLIDGAPNRVSVPWLKTSNSHVAVEAPDHLDYALQLSSSGLSNGTYEAAIFFDTNDPDHPGAKVRVRLTVSGLTPVVLAGFAAAPGPGGVVLTWRTLEEVDHAGFHVHRREVLPEVSEEVRVSPALIPPAVDQTYRFVDPGARGGRTYEYRLADLSRSGQVTFHGPFSVIVPGLALPATLWLAPPSPNPARSRAEIHYGLPAPGPVRLEVFAVSGRLLRILENAELKPAGYYQATWDGRDDQGQAVASGMYFYRLDAAGEHRARKILWVR